MSMACNGQRERRSGGPFLQGRSNLLSVRSLRRRFIAIVRDSSDILTDPFAFPLATTVIAASYNGGPFRVEFNAASLKDEEFEGQLDRDVDLPRSTERGLVEVAGSCSACRRGVLPSAFD